MRKKIVLQSEPCEPPEQIAYRNRETWRRNIPYIYTIAKVQILHCGEGDKETVLNIDLFHNGILAARYFADKQAGSHRAFIVRTGEWKGLCLQNVANMAAGLRPNYHEFTYNADYEPWQYEDPEEEEMAREYLDQDVEYWERDIQREKRYKALDNKQARIDDMMEKEVPDIPEGFYKWLHEVIFGQRHLFQKKLKKKTRITCTACGKKWTAGKSMGIGRKICPKCGREVLGTYKQEIKSAEKSLYLLQPCKTSGNWIERYFRARCIWSPEHVSQVAIDERIRVIVPIGKSWGTCYYEDGVDREGKPVYWDANHFNGRMTNGYLYPGTLAEVKKCMPETLARSGMEILASKGIRFNVNHLIIYWHKEPGMEYIIKGGFTNIAAQMISESFWGGNSKVDLKGRNPQEAFRLDPARTSRLRQMNGNLTVLGWLQYEHMTGTKISQANLMEAEKYGVHCNDADVWKILSYVRSPDGFFNYLRKHANLQHQSRRQTIRDWADYLDMAKKQKLNLSSELFYKPRNLKASHDACVRFAQRGEMRKRAKEILKQFPDVDRILGKIREKYTYQGEKYSIIVPKNVEDIIHEGRSLGHCIDSTDRYFERIQLHITYLVFLRHTEQPDVPWYTLEIEPGGTVRQQRTTGNSQEKRDVKAYTPFIREWQEVVRARITEEDRMLAAASRETRIQEYAKLREDQEKVWRGALAGKLLADVLEADLLEPAT